MAEKGKQASAPPTLTNRDHELIVNALSSVKGGVLTIDYELFAAKSGLKNANVARVAWSGVRKKLGLFQKDGDEKSNSMDGLPVKGSGSGKGKSAEKANEAFQAEQGYEVMLEESEDLKPAKRPRVKKEME